MRSQGSSVGWCSLSIRTGSRDEEGFPAGMAHFLEHTMFKGTSGKSAAAINNALEKLGGELNAFTTKEEIVLHATVLKADIAKAASLLLEIAMDSCFPEEDIEVEKGVVIDEIASYKDSPADDIYDVFEEKLFKGTTLSSPILGTEQSVREITHSDLLRFRRTRFTTGRMTLSMVSPLPEEKMCAIAEKCIRDAVAAYSPIAGEGSPRRSETFATLSRFNETVDKGNNEVNCIMGNFAPKGSDQQQRLATVLLCNMLGGPASNSILGSALRERHGWVYNVECGYTPYSDTGIATIQFGCDKDNLKSCLRTIHRHLKALRDKEISPAKLKAAKRQLLGQNAIALENGETQCISMGKSLMTYGHIPTDRQMEAKVMEISASMIRQRAQEIFDEDRMSTLIYL